MTVVVVGAGSMIAKALRRHPATSHWHILMHDQAVEDTSWVKAADCVINLAFDPRLKTEPYQEAFDLDLLLARLVSESAAHYIMASTRMVYGTPGADLRFAEDQIPRPLNHYGRAKLAAERAVAATLGRRATILRFSNIFDKSEGLGARQSFFGLALQRLLASGCIEFDISPFVGRDFLPADLLADRLVRISADPSPGHFNIGAGFAIPAGRIAQWLIAGYGGGKLLITDFREHDAFWLDVDKSRRTWGFDAVTVEQIRDRCIAIGTEIRSAS